MFRHLQKSILSLKKCQLSNYRNNLFSSLYDVQKLRNIGISAHIDSGKTTFTERILFYGGKIDAIHEVKGSDNVGAKMDSMELEREKGITIQSAATHVQWKDYHINVIDTPGHVDFTIEVERSLRVLDGAIMLVCGAAGVQAQTLTVDKQMKRYKLPRLIFINKLDRMGANYRTAMNSIKSKLNLTIAPVQIPMGTDSGFKGLICLIKMKAYYFEGKSGEKIIEDNIPSEYQEEAKKIRQELIEVLANVNSDIEQLYLEEQEISVEVLDQAIKDCVQATTFCPVFMGSAYKNKGVQLVLDGVSKYLPNPTQKENTGFKLNDSGEEEKVVFQTDSKKPFVGFAFKLEENKFGQLTYVRVYQGKLRKGDYIYNNGAKKRQKISRMVKMHSNEMEDINEVEAGDIFAIFGIECSTGDSLTEGDMTNQLNCSSIFVPAPVLSLQIKPTKKEFSAKFQKALSKFKREDPTFHVNMDKESDEIIISGMGELHLQIYAERMRREFSIDVEVGKPTVNYRETISEKAKFSYTHKKQSGGAGQYAKVIGYVEPIIPTKEGVYTNTFVNEIVGTAIPNEFIGAIEKGFYEAVEKGPMTGYPVVNFKYVLQDGQTHIVDSSQLAFMTATKLSFLDVFYKAEPQILEPIMQMEVSVSKQEYSAVMANISKRRGLITNTETQGDMFVMTADVPLSQMFGFATELRGLTAGQGEFSMEYKKHDAVPPNEVQAIMDAYQKKKRSSE